MVLRVLKCPLYQIIYELCYTDGGLVATWTRIVYYVELDQ